VDPGRVGARERGAGLRGLGQRPRGRQRLLHRAPHRLVQRAAVAEAHLDLGRVHVDVHAVGRQLQEEHVARLAAAVQLVLVGRAHRVRDQPVAHVAAVDEQVLLVGPAARRLGPADAALQLQRPVAGRQRAAGGDEVGAQHVGQPRRGLGRAPLGGQPAVVPDREAHVRARQRVAAHRLQRVRELGGVGLEELASRRGAEEQLVHLHRGAAAARGGLQFAAARVQPMRHRRAVGPAGERDRGHAGDGG
jgi:hypothetical protein